MAVTIPNRFDLLTGSGSRIFAAIEPIRATYATPLGVSRLVRNNAWLYAKLNRRTVFEWTCIGNFADAIVNRNPLTTTSSSYETIFEVPARLSANTDKLTFVARGYQIYVEVTVWANPDKTSSLAVMAQNIETPETTLTETSASLAGNENVTIEVKVKYDTSSPGSLYALHIYEEDLVTADLP